MPRLMHTARKRKPDQGDYLMIYLTKKGKDDGYFAVSDTSIEELYSFAKALSHKHKLGGVSYPWVKIRAPEEIATARIRAGADAVITENVPEFYENKIKPVWAKIDKPKVFSQWRPS